MERQMLDGQITDRQIGGQTDRWTDLWVNRWAHAR